MGELTRLEIEMIMGLLAKEFRNRRADPKKQDEYQAISDKLMAHHLERKKTDANYS